MKVESVCYYNDILEGVAIEVLNSLFPFVFLETFPLPFNFFNKFPVPT